MAFRDNGSRLWSFENTHTQNSNNTNTKAGPRPFAWAVVVFGVGGFSSTKESVAKMFLLKRALANVHILGAIMRSPITKLKPRQSDRLNANVWKILHSDHSTH